MKIQKRATEPKEFLGITTYMSPFTPNILAQTVTFREPIINLAAATQTATALLCIQQYSVQLKYRPGKKFVFADPLSRQSCENENTIELDITNTFVQFSIQKLHRHYVSRWEVMQTCWALSQWSPMACLNAYDNCQCHCEHCGHTMMNHYSRMD